MRFIFICMYYSYSEIPKEVERVKRDLVNFCYEVKMKLNC